MKGLENTSMLVFLLGPPEWEKKLEKFLTCSRGEKEPAIKSFLKIVISRLTFFWDCVFVVFYEVE